MRLKNLLAAIRKALASKKPALDGEFNQAVFSKPGSGMSSAESSSMATLKRIYEDRLAKDQLKARVAPCVVSHREPPSLVTHLLIRHRKHNQ